MTFNIITKGIFLITLLIAIYGMTTDPVAARMIGVWFSAIVCIGTPLMFGVGCIISMIINGGALELPWGSSKYEFNEHEPINTSFQDASKDVDLIPKNEPFIVICKSGIVSNDHINSTGEGWVGESCWNEKIGRFVISTNSKNHEERQISFAEFPEGFFWAKC